MKLEDAIGAEKKEEITAKTEKRCIGRVIKVAESEGWGFITSKDVPFTRIFFHWTSLAQDTLNFTEVKKGMDVEFTVTKTPLGKIRAIRIKVLGTSGSVDEATEKGE